MSEIPPGIVGAGLTGRRQVRPPNDDLEPLDEDGNPLSGLPPAEGKSLPASCLRVLHSPLQQGQGGECPFDCPGRQPEDVCLADLVRYCNEHGIEWSFDVRITEAGPIWVYDGPSLD